MTGDGIIALENAPQRTIPLTYATHQETVRYSDEIKKEK